MLFTSCFDEILNIKSPVPEMFSVEPIVLTIELFDEVTIIFSEILEARRLARSVVLSALRSFSSEDVRSIVPLLI